MGFGASSCAAIAAVLAMLLARAAFAQCGTTASSCVNCHEVERRRSVLDDRMPWHADHAFGNFCQPCHGGDSSANDEALAHATLVDPLGDPEVTCVPCHADGAVRVQRYRSVRQARAAAVRPPVPPSPVSSAQCGEMRRPDLRNTALASLVLLVGIAGTGFVVHHERRLHRT